MIRALRAATVGAVLVGPFVLGACSAGQVTQTATQLRDKVGGTADAGTVLLRAFELEYPSGGSFDRGDDVELLGAIVNNGDRPDTLVAITSDAFEGVRVLGPDATGAGSGSGVDSEVAVEIPTDTPIYLGTGDAPTVLLENLTGELTAGQGIELTMTFENAGEVTVRALVDNPAEELARGEAFDFHHEEAELGEEGLPEGGSEVGGHGGEEGGE